MARIGLSLCINLSMSRLYPALAQGYTLQREGRRKEGKEERERKKGKGRKEKEERDECRKKGRKGRKE